MESMDDPKYTAAKARTGASIRGTPSTFFSPSPYQSVILSLSLFFFFRNITAPQSQWWCNIEHVAQLSVCHCFGIF